MRRPTTPVRSVLFAQIDRELSMTPVKTHARFRLLAVVGFVVIGMLWIGLAPAGAKDKQDDSTQAVNYDVSPPLSDLAPAPPPADKTKKEKEPKKGLPVPAASTSDPVIQTSPGADAAPALGAGFEGVGQG